MPKSVAVYIVKDGCILHEHTPHFDVLGNTHTHTKWWFMDTLSRLLSPTINKTLKVSHSPTHLGTESVYR